MLIIVAKKGNNQVLSNMNVDISEVFFSLRGRELAQGLYESSGC